MKHIVLWGAWYGSHNVGDQVLLLTIMDILTRVVGDVRFTVLTNNPQHVTEYTRTESSCRSTAVHNRKQFGRLVQSLASCDLFVFGGGVPFYEERSHVLAMALMAGIARAARTPYMTWTVSSQEVQDTFAKRVFGWVVNGARAITYRDENTHRLFVSCGVNRPMYLTGDSGFWLEPADTVKAEMLLRRYGLGESSRPLVALTPRTLRGRDGEAEMHYNPKTEEQIEKSIACFTAVLDWLWENGYQPLMVPMNTFAPDDDRVAARQVMMRAVHGKHAILIDEEIRPRVAPLVYQRCQASFVARVHGSITSMVGQCPMMMYAFAPKHAGIMASMGMQDYALSEAGAAPERAVAMMADLLAKRSVLQPEMRIRLEVLRQEALIPAQFAAQIMGLQPAPAA
jgi:polysaccharide pyruvyl transferase WcaK-like protein